MATQKKYYINTAWNNPDKNFTDALNDLDLGRYFLEEKYHAIRRRFI